MVLPDGIKFLSLGWFVLHAIAILLAYQFGYNKGRGDEKREWRAREIEKGR
jgi:hypothetical protein